VTGSPYDHDDAKPRRELRPSARGGGDPDLNLGLRAGKLSVERLGRGFAWLDTGTSQSLLEASEFVAMLERRQGLKICCPEEIALRLGYVTPSQLEPWLARITKSDYGDYVLRIARLVEATSGN
jgi:glucose-1-phosphate thymidylyltransferase